MHVETRYFLTFENILGTATIFQNRRTFTTYYFLQKVSYIQWKLLDLKLVSMQYFLEKRAGFYVILNLKLKKEVTSLPFPFAL